MPSGYNNNVQLIQTRDYVVILNEMVHDAGRADHQPATAPADGWATRAGAGRATRWSSRRATSPRTALARWPAPPSDQLRLTERFTLRDPRTLIYQFTVDDPATWTRPWTAAVPMQKSDEDIYECACHEGNLGMIGIMAGAREQGVVPLTVNPSSSFLAAGGFMKWWLRSFVLVSLVTAAGYAAPRSGPPRRQETARPAPPPRRGDRDAESVGISTERLGRLHRSRGRMKRSSPATARWSTFMRPGSRTSRARRRCARTRFSASRR